MDEKNKTTPNRRQFIKISAAAAGAAMMPIQMRAGSTPVTADKNEFQLGIASYTFRKFSLDDTLKMTKQLAIERIALKSFHLPLDSSKAEIEEVAQKVRSAGLTLYGAGVIYMKDESEVLNAFNYAQTAGIKIIIGVPEHDLLPLVERKAKETNIMVAIHNHGPGDEKYPSPQSIFDRIESLDKRIGICLDVGHVQRYGLDPVKEIDKYGRRILDVHIKDVNGSDKDAKTVEIGRGVIDIPGVLTALRKAEFSGTLAFEFEKDEESPLTGLAESVGYVRGVLDML
jgi:inosose dehydratase